MIEEKETVETVENTETNQWINALAYIVFFIPLLVDSNNATYKFHTNQGLNLFILTVAVNFIGWLLPVVGWLIILPLGGLLCLILAIIGIVNALSGKEKELPIIGKFNLIK